MEQPECAAQSGHHRRADHQEKFAMEMSVTTAKDEKKLIGKDGRTKEDNRAEKNYAAGDRSIKVTQFPFVVAPGESGHENVCQHVHQDGENHGEPAERADFCNRCRAMCEKTDQENGDLSLKTIKERVRSQTLDQPHNLLSIFCVLIRI